VKNGQLMSEYVGRIVTQGIKQIHFDICASRVKFQRLRENL
jgi:hypothetical protein